MNLNPGIEEDAMYHVEMYMMYVGPKSPGFSVGVHHVHKNVYHIDSQGSGLIIGKYNKC